MKKHIRCIVGLCLGLALSLPLMLQAQEISLPRHVREHLLRAGNNARKVDILLAYAEAKDTGSKQAQNCALHALTLALQIDYHDGIAAANYRLGVLASLQGQVRQAIDYYTKSSTYYSHILEQRPQARDIQQKLSRVYWSTIAALLANDKHRQALAVYRKLLPISRRSGDRDETAFTLHQMALSESRSGDFQAALGHFIEVLKMQEQAGDSAARADLLNDVGTNFYRMGRYEKALDYFRQALDMRKRMADKEGQIAPLINMGVIHSDQGDYDRALALYLEALQQFTSQEGSEWQVDVLVNVGSVYVKKQDLPSALTYYRRALDLSRAIGYRESLAGCYLNISQVFLLQKKFTAAITYANTGLAIARKDENKPLEVQFYQALSDIFHQKGDYAAAYRNLLQYDGLKEELYNQESRNNMAELQAKYESEKKDKEIKVLLRDNQIQQLNLARQQNIKNFLIAGFVLMTLLVLAAWYSYRLKMRTNRVLTLQQEKLRQANAAKDTLFSIVAHDLKNPFNTLISLSDMLVDDYDAYNDTERKHVITGMYQAAKNMFKLLENLLQWARSQTGSIERRPAAVDVSLQVDETLVVFHSQAEQKGITLRNRVPAKTLVWADQNMVAVVLRNLISNAIKFSRQGDSVTCAAKEQAEMVEICVQDTGVGIAGEDQDKLFRLDTKYRTPGTQSETGTGLGLILCREFIQKNGGAIWVRSEPGAGSTFCFSLPKEPEGAQS